MNKLKTLSQSARELREVYEDDEKTFICPLCPNTDQTCELRPEYTPGVLLPLDRERYTKEDKEFSADQFDVLRSKDGHWQITQFTTNYKYLRLGDWRNFGKFGKPPPVENKTKKKTTVSGVKPLQPIKKSQKKRPHQEEKDEEDIDAEENDIYASSEGKTNSPSKKKTTKAKKKNKSEVDKLVCVCVLCILFQRI